MTVLREEVERETKFAMIAKKARENPGEIFTSLAHHMNEEFLISSFRKLRKTASCGIDGKTCYDYELNLPVKIAGLYKRLRDWGYKAPNIRRTWIDKEPGKKRPLGISTVEDNFDHQILRELL